MFGIKHLKNRMQAGAMLAQRLEAYAGRPDAIVLALPRGGVPVGFAVAEELHLPLDVLLVRKLGVPGHEEYAMGAVTSGGLGVLQRDVIEQLNISQEAIDAVTQRKLQEIEERETMYRPNRPPVQLEGRIVLVIDDGLATGSTMRAAVQALRLAKPARIVVAVPVAARDTCASIGMQVDEMICLHTPEPFYAVSLWYEDFRQTSDEEVKTLLDKAARIHARRSEAEHA